MAGIAPRESAPDTAPDKIFSYFFYSPIDKSGILLYNTQAVRREPMAPINAAIAQPVERILGKDEVASSNLASSSKQSPL